VRRAATGALARVVRASVAALALLGAGTLGGCAGGARMPKLPRFGANLLPPVVPWHADTLTLSERRFHRVDAPGFEVYAQSAEQIPALQAQLAATAQEFGRHFGGAPKVAVLLLDAPADPYRDFDFAPFVARRMQVLAFVRTRDAQKDGALGVDEGLLAARLAELFLASYADSVLREVGTPGDPTARKALDALPHWFTEAAVSRIARPDAVESGVRFVRANRLRLMPLGRLFAMARLGMPTWSELAQRSGVVRVYTEPMQHTPPPLLAAESTAFGEFLVSQYGPSFLQAVADELLKGSATEDALAAMPGVPGDRRALEQAWGAWLGERR
jgi:hypothetical protein